MSVDSLSKFSKILMVTKLRIYSLPQVILTVLMNKMQFPILMLHLVVTKVLQISVKEYLVILKHLKMGNTNSTYVSKLFFYLKML